MSARRPNRPIRRPGFASGLVAAGVVLALAGTAGAQSSLGGAQQPVPPPTRPSGESAPVVRPSGQTQPRPASPQARQTQQQRNQQGQTRQQGQQGQSQQRRRPPAAAAPPAPPPPPPAAPEPAPEPQPSIGAVTGLALPRYATLRSDEVNMRAGPGTRFPIEWTYQRRDMPVEIVREFELWRRIRDVEGIEGWVHQSTLATSAARRTFIVRPAGVAVAAPAARSGAAPAPTSIPQEIALRRRPEDNAALVARLRPGVIGRLRSCEATATWCEAQVGEYRGYVRRADIWGIGAQEEIR
jgi:SH3-like domain-containing protein